MSSNDCRMTHENRTKIHIIPELCQKTKLCPQCTMEHSLRSLPKDEHFSQVLVHRVVHGVVDHAVDTLFDKAARASRGILINLLVDGRVDKAIRLLIVVIAVIIIAVAVVGGVVIVVVSAVVGGSGLVDELCF